MAGGSSPHIKFWDTLFISETIRVRKLKVGRLVGIYALYKKLSARGRVGGTAAPNLYFKTPSIALELVELGS